MTKYARPQSPVSSKNPDVPHNPAPPPRRRPDVIASDAFHDKHLKAFGENDDFFRGAKMSHGGIKAAIDSVEHLADNPDPRDTEAAHAQKLEKAARDAANKIEGRFKSIVENNIQARRAVEYEIDKTLGTTADSAHGKEIRQYLAGLEPDERRQVIQQRALDGDSDTLAAALHGPSLLTGLGEGEAQALRRHVAHTRAPDLVKRADALAEAGDTLESAAAEGASWLRRQFGDATREHAGEVDKAEQAGAELDEVLTRL